MPSATPTSTPTSTPNPAHVTAVRRFNRFYTRWLGLLDEHHLASEFTLTEVRVLYELAHRGPCSAAELKRELALDAGYLSRILAKFSTRKMLDKQRAPGDARQTLLSLSKTGRTVFAPLQRGAEKQLAGLLGELTPAQTHELVAAMQRIEALLAPAEAAPATAKPAQAFILREPRVGDLGAVIRGQGLLYAQEYGWDASFEALVAEIGARFVQRFDPAWERCWIAERDGQVIGSVFLVRKSARVAQLRLLYVDASARGLGLGARLVDECLRFAREKGYKRMTLWTNNILVAARRIYQARGFVLVKEERHSSFGKNLVGQHWDLDLTRPLPARA